MAFGGPTSRPCAVILQPTSEGIEIWDHATGIAGGVLSLVRVRMTIGEWTVGPLGDQRRSTADIAGITISQGLDLPIY
jgi:hypothetical protein